LANHGVIVYLTNTEDKMLLVYLLGGIFSGIFSGLLFSTVSRLQSKND
jgi:uncharacterized membrane-anchored protein YitT (DUF2179 family)